MEEQNAKYPRLILINETLSVLRTEYPEQQIEQFAVRYFDGFYTVNCFSMVVNYRKEPGIKKLIDKYVIRILDNTLDMSLSGKYLYVGDKLKHLE
ncbi:MAG: hypothetical protein K2L42_04760 [Clostridia bacterium]|nr:hypothetical protein [Clostridia bacterium]